MLILNNDAIDENDRPFWNLEFSQQSSPQNGKLEIIERYIKYRVKSTFVSKKQVLEIAKSIEF